MRAEGLSEGEATTMRDSDEASIGALMTSFLHAVSFKAGDQPRYGELTALFGPHARLIRTSGRAPEISTLDQFVQTRQSAVDAGELTSFEEVELTQTTEMFGNVAHRFSALRQAGNDKARLDRRARCDLDAVHPHGSRVAHQLDGLGRRAR